MLSYFCCEVFVLIAVIVCLLWCLILDWIELDVLYNSIGRFQFVWFLLLLEFWVDLMLVFVIWFDLIFVCAGSLFWNWFVVRVFCLIVLACNLVCLILWVNGWLQWLLACVVRCYCTGVLRTRIVCCLCVWVWYFIVWLCCDWCDNLVTFTGVSLTVVGFIAWWRVCILCLD